MGLKRAPVGKALVSRSLDPISTMAAVVELSARTEKWIARLIDGLNEHVDEKTRALMLEQCGRQCQSQSLIKKAKDIYQKSENTSDFLEKLGEAYKHLHVEGGRAYIIYPKCYCSQVNKIPKGKLSGTYCNCSRGWAKALFEGAMGKPVEVTMEKSIINGDDECRFRITF
jgi:predicted ArsR family transcriptional regulator